MRTESGTGERRRPLARFLLLGLGLAALTVVLCACPGATPPLKVLSLVIDGTGNGSLSVNGLDCTETCDVEVTSSQIHTVSATPAAGSELAVWTGCDGVTESECSVFVGADRTVTATFDLIDDGEDPPPGADPGDPNDPGDPDDPDPPARTGNLAVAFSGLPSGIENLGHVRLTSSTGEVIGVLESKTLHDLPVGEYAVAALGLEVCDSTVQPLAPPDFVTITEDETTNLEIVYGGDSISTQGFRAVIRGVHSNGGEVLGYVTVTEEGEDVGVLACFRYEHSGDLDNPSVRHGNPYDVFVEDAPVVLALSPVEQDCFETVDFHCYLYVGGVGEFSPEQTSAFRNGEYYFYAESWNTYGVKMVAQLGSETVSPTPAVGAELKVVIGDMPPELEGFRLCLEGRFYLQEEGFYGAVCLDLIEDIGETIFSDIFPDQYEAFIERPTGQFETPPGLVVTGSPVDVASGEVGTITVSYEE